MNIKVMKGIDDNATLHDTVTIDANKKSTIYFSQSGFYFTKSKAVLQDKEPIYQKGQPFQVTNDRTGYSVLTLTFSITESNVPQALGGKRITSTEFDKN